MLHLWLIPAFPLLGFLVNGVIGRRRSNAFVSAAADGAVYAGAPATTIRAERYGV